MEFQLVRLDQLIIIFQIHRLRGLIKLVPAIKKQHQLVMVMSRHYYESDTIQSWIVDTGCATAGGAKSKPDDQFWHIRPHTIVGSEDSTINSKDP